MRKKKTDTVRATTVPQKRRSTTSRESKSTLKKNLSASLPERTDCAWRWNLSSNKIAYGKGFLANLGYTKTNLPKEKTLLKGIIHTRDAGTLRMRLQAFLDGKADELDIECRLRAKTGGYKWHRVHGNVVKRDKSGRSLACSGNIRDIHQQKVAQDKLAKSQPKSSTGSLDDLAESQAALSAIFQAAKDAIWVVDPKTFTLVFFNKTFEDLLLKVSGFRARVGMHVEEADPAGAENWFKFYMQVLRNGQAETDYQISGTMDTIHVVSRCLIRGDGVIYGIVAFGHDITEQMRTDKCLRKSEEKFSALFHHSPLAVMLTSMSDDRYIEVNEAFEELTGFRREEVLGKTPSDFGVWVNPSARLKLKEDLVSNGRARLEFEYKTKAGEICSALGSASLIEIDGELCMLGVSTDITERKRAEKALNKSEEKYSALAHQKSIAIVSASMVDDRFLEVNEAFEEATGYKRSEVIGRTPGDIELWENPDERLKFKKKLMTNGHGYVEFNYRTKMGEICPAIGSAVLIEIDGESCALGMAVDISARRRAEEALRESEERLRIAIDSVRMYAFEWNPETDAVQLSAASHAILEINGKSTAFTRAEIVNRIVPEDRAHFQRTINSLSPANPNYKVAFRMMNGGQKMVWLEESGRAFFDPDGKLRKVIGMTFDATEARTSEHLLRELSGRLINSQEEERRRVARELHDHIGQELSLLCVQAQSLDSGTSDAKHTAHADVHELYGRIKEIAIEVSKLSHRLHSSELAFLGLPAAAERLCRDFNSQHKIDMDYHINNIRGLDGAKSLCFYRILQEALQNVSKHSHASRVLVELMRRDEELILRVVDNGVGFEPDFIHVDSGLGLISIRERLNLIGGRMEINSKVGGGTSLLAAVSVLNVIQ